MLGSSARDIHDLKGLYPEDAGLAQWAEAVHQVYTEAKPSAFVRSRLGLDVDVIEVDQHDGVQQEVGAPAPAPVDPPASAFLEGCCRLCGVPLVLRRRVQGITVCST